MGTTMLCSAQEGLTLVHNSSNLCPKLAVTTKILFQLCIFDDPGDVQNPVYTCAYRSSMHVSTQSKELRFGLQ